MLKRAFDLIISFLGLLFFWPLLLAIAVLVKLGSDGPAFYPGVRIGRNGKPFKMYKFRTMSEDAERMGTTTADRDPRITRVGGFLRKYKLDELPQLFNVLRGEMSLVGPRPEVEEHTRVYNQEEKGILSVLPGITDYSSIRFVNLGKELGSENAHQVFVTRLRAEKNQLRLKYVKNRSFGEDMRILLMTFLTLARKAIGRTGGN
jgi:lipopolysaccharide/colanic/teichoic acid biosynthesis glycosyltransferase